MDDVAGANGNGPSEDGAVTDEGVKFAVFTARIGVRGKIAEKGFVEFSAGKAGEEDSRIDADGDGAEALHMKFANQFAGVALPDRKQSGHADAREVFLAIDAKVFEENVPKGDLANALIVKDAEGVLHARFVDGIDALRRDANFVQGQPDRVGLLKEEFATDTVH